MTKFLWRASVTLWVAILCFWAFIGGFTYAQSDAPKLSLEQHDQIATLKAEDLQTLVNQEAYQKKYQDMLNADPGFKELVAKRETIEKKLQELVQAAMKGVDPKKWTFDMRDIKFMPVTPEKGEEKK